MTESIPARYTSFDAHRRIATGSLPVNALAVKRARARGAAGPLLIFDNTTGRSVDVDTRGSDAAVVARLAAIAAEPAAHNAAVAPAEPRGRGRPKLGVVPREVTLLPRHWEWLAGQPGGASVVLRKLVEQARRASSEKDRVREAHERAYHFMLAMAGDLPGFEEATRALFAHDPVAFEAQMAAWPCDIRAHALQMAASD